MAHTIAEKILAAKSDRDEVFPGEFIMAKVDLVLASELSGVVAIEEFNKVNGASIFDPDKVVFVMDHFTPNKDIKSAEIVKECRSFARQHGIRFYDVGRAGIQHILLPEKGLVVQGDLIAGADSHTCTYGFIGAFGTGIGSTDAAAAMILGEIWLKVPESLLFTYSGIPPAWVGGKDLILHTISHIGVDGARYQVMEMTGDAFQHLSMADRFSMANMAIEAGGSETRRRNILARAYPPERVGLRFTLPRLLLTRHSLDPELHKRGVHCAVDFLGPRRHVTRTRPRVTVVENHDDVVGRQHA